MPTIKELRTIRKKAYEKWNLTYDKWRMIDKELDDMGVAYRRAAKNYNLAKNVPCVKLDD